MSSFLAGLLEVNIAAGAAILLVMCVRGLVRRAMGPGAAYLLWSVVPVAMLATLIPSREVTVLIPAEPGADPFWAAALNPAVVAGLMLAWLAGAAVMTARLVERQRLFMRDVELGVAGPAVVGFFYTQIVTPSDFKRRFDYQEQTLILAHEGVHLERGDARVNGVVALIRCLMWFNPLVHLGAKRLRADQELSCDAAVIDRRPKTRKIYAETLLKTNLSARPLPVGCYWPAPDRHPLTERIDMLTRSPFSHSRRLAAAGAVIALVAGGGFAAWAAQPAREVLAEIPEVFISFDPIVGDEFPGISVRLLPPDTGDPDERRRQDR